MLLRAHKSGFLLILALCFFENVSFDVMKAYFFSSLIHHVRKMHENNAENISCMCNILCIKREPNFDSFDLFTL